MARTQQARPIAIATPLGEDVVLVESLSVSDQLGRLFRIDLELLSEDGSIAFDDIVGENVTVRLETPRQTTRYFNGVVSYFGQRGSAGRLASYQATVVPWLWFLTRTSDCRIFQEKTVPEILETVFRDHGMTDFENRLSGQHRAWEYCVQYRETSFDFVSRLMEQEGIYYYFEHDNGKHTLILANGSSAHSAYPDYEELAYRPPHQASTDPERIRAWAFGKQVEPGGYALNDFDFKAPKKDLGTLSKIARQHAAADFEMYDYPGEYTEYSNGESYARVRIEELQAQHQVARGESDARGICVGHTFQFVDYDRDDQCIEYLVTGLTLHAQADQYDSSGAPTGKGPLCRCSFTAIDSATPFRPARITPKPSIRGCQTAVVVGKSGEEIDTDEYGRVKVKFHWDRYSKGDETSSCWIRVSQPWAGRKWGGMFLPRIGQEVIVEFLEGDPDQPIITGRVYNGDNMPPYTLATNKTMSTLKSLSSKGGGGFNELRFEDKKGEEQVFIHAEKNQDVRVKNDCFETIGNNRHLVITKDQFEHVKNKRHEKVDVDHMEEVTNDRHLKVGGKEAKEVVGSKSLTVTGDVIEVFKMNHSEETTQGLFLKAMNVQIEGMTEIELKCGGSSIVLTPAAIFIVGGPLVNINSGAGPPVVKPPLNAVAPTAPTEAEEADTADPGEVADVKAKQREMKAGKYGSVQVKPYKPSSEKKNWVEIELVGEDGSPVAGERYRIELPDGSVAEGSLDGNGRARIDGIDPGTCTITFPNLDKDAWEGA